MKNKDDFKLFISLCLWMVIPSLYQAIRMHIVAINGVDINILGQMEWFDLIDEIIVTTLTVPLYYVLKKDGISKEKNMAALLISFGIYAIFTLFMAAKVGNIAEFMNATNAKEYLLLETISMLIAYIGSFTVIIFTLQDDHKTIGIMTVIKLVLLSVCDYYLIKKYAEAGSSYSEILVNAIIAAVAVILCYARRYFAFGKTNLGWLKDWFRTGIFTGFQIFLDNWFYAIMICKMVNAVSQSGNYWVANNFIWGWLLIPVTAYAEIIKKNKLEKLDYKNTWKAALLIALVWLVTLPGWRWFITTVLASDANNILAIVLPVIPFYVPYMCSFFIDAWFISKGRTQYAAMISAFCNIVYYGSLYILFQKGIFTANMNFIIQMFGWGNVVHLLASIFFYWFERKKTSRNSLIVRL